MADTGGLSPPGEIRASSSLATRTIFKAVLAQLVEHLLAMQKVISSNLIYRSRNHMTVIKLDNDNRMLRLGFGKNKGRWFARIDLWFFGIRLS